MNDQTSRPAMTMREIREGLGHVKPGQPEVIVSITRYTVSVLPADDINHKHFALFVELKPNGWVVTDGHAFYAGNGTWQPAQWLAHHFADHDDALAFARETAPEMTVNGHTATEAYRRTHPEELPDEPEPSLAGRATVRCSAAVLSRPHGPHAWEPQPGMVPVLCPGSAAA